MRHLRMSEELEMEEGTEEYYSGPLSIDTEEGVCGNCGYIEQRPPEELEPGSVCPQCKEPTFGGTSLHGPEEGSEV